MAPATKKNCQRVLAASLRVVSAMTGNPPQGPAHLSIFQTVLRSEVNTTTINNYNDYNAAIFLEDQEGIDKALEHLTGFIMITARCIFKQKKTLNSRKKKTE